MQKELPTLILTPGEPAGIGPDLAVKLAQQLLTSPADFRLVLAADPTLLQQRAAALDINQTDLPMWSPTTNASVSILPITTKTAVTPGKLDSSNSAYVLETVEQAVSGCMDGKFDALVTGPIHKGIINDAGIAFSGHTEMLAQLCGANNVVMMLIARTNDSPMRVALVTTHLPLADVSVAITPESLEKTIRTLNKDLQYRFGIDKPRILVCGLNPHAGESGYLGKEEIEIIIPVIERLKKEDISLLGPVPADTAFTQNMLAQCDVVLAMYHDQGLPVLKHAGFGRAVNVTLGLPIIRTSVDHGTAIELAGTGNIDHGSLDAAIQLAHEMAVN